MKAIYLVPLLVFVSILGAAEAAFAIEVQHAAPPGMFAGPPSGLLFDLAPLDPTPIPDDDAKCTTCQGTALMEAGQYGRAMDIFQRRAAEGDAVAMANLGVMYQHGLGTPVDYDHAMRLYRQAAKKGQSMAMNQIGFMFLHGLGVKVDLDTAYCWFEWSSVQGNDRASGHIADLEAMGRQPPSSCEVVNNL